MGNFNYQAELKKIIDTKQLVEIYHRNSSTFGVVYLLNANDEFLTIATLSVSNNTYEGVAIVPMDDIESITVDTLYLKTIAARISSDSIYQQALADVKGIEDFTFAGFISYLEKSASLGYLSIDDGGGEIVRIVGHDDNMIAVDEYTEGRKDRVAHTYYKFEDIVGIGLNTPRLRIVEDFLSK